MRLFSLMALMTLPLVAVAEPRIDVFDESFNYIRTIAPPTSGAQFIADIEVGADGHVWALMSDTSHARNRCHPNDMIVRLDTNDNVVATYKAGLHHMVGFAIDPAGGYWISGRPDCGAIGSQLPYRVNASDQITASGSVSFSAADIELLPNGRVAAGMGSGELRTYDPVTMATLSTSGGFGGHTLQRLDYNHVTGNVVVGRRAHGSNPDSVLRFATDGTYLGFDPMAPLGLDFPQDIGVLTDGRVVVYQDRVDNGVTANILSSSHTSVLQSEQVTLSRRQFSSAGNDANGNIYVASWWAERIDVLSLNLAPTSVGAVSSLTLSFVTPVDVEPGAHIDLNLVTPLDVSQVLPTDAEIITGLDGTLSFVPDDGLSGPGFLQFGRTGGTTTPAGTTVSIRLNGLVNPAEPTDIDVYSVSVRTEQYGATVAERTDETPTLQIGSSINCVIGDPFDADDDGTDDYCKGPFAVISPKAVIESGADMGNVVVGDYATVSSGTAIHHDVVIAPRATIGADATLQTGAVVSRGATVGASSTLGDSVVVGRSAQVGANSFVPSGSTLGYSSTLGANVVLDSAIVLGSLATLGGDTAAMDAVDCVGALVIGRGSQIAADAPHTLTCLGSAVIGPDTTIASGATFGDELRVRKKGLIGSGFTSGSNVRIGREADFGANVTLTEDTKVAASIVLCDNAAVSGVIPRGYSDPGCQ